MEDRIKEAIAGNKYVQRLKNIHQLGITRYDPRFRSATHTRYDHSEYAAEFAETLFILNTASRRLATEAYVASWLHDIAMPAYSQQGQFLADIDEEEEAEKILRKPEFDSLFKMVSRDPVLKLIKGEKTGYGFGSLGYTAINNRGIDVDKIAYVLLDAKTLGWDISHVENIWRYMIVNGEGAVFLNPEIVRDFLYLRARLFRDVYRDRRVLEREAYFLFVAKNLKPTKDELMEMTDNDFDQKILEIEPNFFEKISADDPPMRQVAVVMRDRKVTKSSAQSLATGAFVKAQPSYNPATSIKIHMSDGTFRKFKDVFPEDSAKIESMFTGYVGIYEYVDRREKKSDEVNAIDEVKLIDEGAIKSI